MKTLFLILTLATISAAEWRVIPYEEARAQWGAMPRERIIAAAEKGDASAQYYLGRVYHQEQNGAEAVRWFEKAAKQKIANAQGNLGKILAMGDGGATVDLPRAIALLTEAAEAGTPTIYNQLGWAHFLDRNLDQAIEAFDKGAKLGDLESLYKMGRIYEEPPKRDAEKALEIFRKGAQAGHAESMISVARMLAYNSSARGESIMWLEKAAALGHKNAPGLLRNIREEGNFYGRQSYTSYTGGPDDIRASEEAERMEKTDPETARAIYLALKGHTPISAYKLGPMYEHGIGVAKDDEEAIYYYSSAVGHNTGPRKEESGANLIRMIAAGRSKQNKTQIAELLTRRKLDSPTNNFAIGRLFDEGKVVRMDLPLAVEYYTRAARAEYAEAQFRLGELWAEGANGQPDEAEARRWFELAAARGHAGAAKRLAK